MHESGHIWPRVPRRRKAIHDWRASIDARRGTVNLSSPRAIFAGSPPRFTRSRVTYEAYAVSRTSTRPQVDSAFGVFGASLMGSVAIRRMQGSSTPYRIPMASLLLKLPTGALTAAAGLMLIRAASHGSIIAPPSTAQLVAYALIFGAGQQTITSLIDTQAQKVLNAITPN